MSQYVIYIIYFLVHFMKEIGFLGLAYIHTETELTIFRKHLPVKRLFHLQVARGHFGKMCVGVYVNM